MADQDLVGRLQTWIKNSNAYQVHSSYVVYAGGDRLLVQVLDQGEESEYTFVVHVRNETTGEVFQRGNGGSTPEEALDVFQWQSIRFSSDGD